MGVRDKRRRMQPDAAAGRVPEIPGYEDLTPIGRGGFAVVYRARATAFDRDVAIKVLSRQRLDDRTRRRFEQERRTMGALSAHPNIVTIFDAGLLSDSVPFLVMAYLPRGSLADQLAKRGPMPWSQAVPIGVKLAGALEAAHRAGVLHRDVKPENVMVSAYGEPELGDFGIARVTDVSDTRSTEVNLSVPYAAPEIVNGDPYTQGSDVYSLAATLYALLAGHPPFHVPDEDSIIPMLMRISTDPVPDLRRHGVPGRVVTVIEQALEKSPRDRFDSARELGEALQEAERALGAAVTPLPAALPDEEAPPAAPPVPTAPVAPPAPSSVQPPPSLPSRRRSRFLLAGAVLVAVAVAAALLLTRDPSRSERSATAATTTTTLAAAATTVASVPAAFPGGEGDLPAGTYRSVALRLPVRFAVGVGWRSGGTEEPDVLDLRPAGSNGTEALSFLVVDTVLDPGRTFSGRRSDLAEAGAKLPVPSGGLLQWLLDHPRLQVTTPVPVRLGGLAAVRIDVRVADPYQYGEVCARCVVLFASGGGYGLSTDTTNRLFVAETDRGWLVAAVEAAPERFASFAAGAERVLATLAVD